MDTNRAWQIFGYQFSPVILTALYCYKCKHLKYVCLWSVSALPHLWQRIMADVHVIVTSAIVGLPGWGHLRSRHVHCDKWGHSVPNGGTCAPDMCTTHHNKWGHLVPNGGTCAPDMCIVHHNKWGHSVPNGGTCAPDMCILHHSKWGHLVPNGGTCTPYYST